MVLIGGMGIDVLMMLSTIPYLRRTDRRLDGGVALGYFYASTGRTISTHTISNNKFTAFEIIDITGTGK